MNEEVREPHAIVERILGPLADSIAIARGGEG